MTDEESKLDKTIGEAHDIIKGVVEGTIPVSVKRHQHAFTLICNDCGEKVALETNGD